jgi:hypothetical protein
MADLTRKEMEDILLAHEIAELEYDVPATMATLVPNPHYEIATFGLQVDGWDSINATYDRLIMGGARDRNVQAVARVIAEARNTLIREAHVSFDMPDGERVTGLYLVVMEFDPEQKKIVGERMYTDPVFGAFLAETLGEDFSTLPGVTPLKGSMPIISEHDAFEAAAARGIHINNPHNTAQVKN